MKWKEEKIGEKEGIWKVIIKKINKLIVGY